MFDKNFMVIDKKFYSLSQILLHWLVALLVLLQLATNSDIAKTFQIFINTGEWPNELGNKTVLHIIIGFFILFGMLLRLYLRLKTKIPALPSKIPTSLKFLAKSSHFFIYFFLFLMPMSGIIGWFMGLKLAIVIHAYSSKILLALIIFHICAAIFHEGVLGNKILHRMIQHKENAKY